MNFSRLIPVFVSLIAIGCSGDPGDEGPDMMRSGFNERDGQPATKSPPIAAVAIDRGGQLPTTMSLMHSDDSQVTQECSLFMSHGDPHESNSCGAKWDNQLEGAFTAVRATDAGDSLPASADKADGATKARRFLLIKTQSKGANHPEATYNTGIGVLLGESVVTYNAKSDVLTINGQVFEGDQFMDWRKADLNAGGMVFRRDQGTGENGSGKGTKTFLLVSPMGDKIQVDVRGAANNRYLNIYGQVSLARGARTIRGSLGAYEGALPNADVSKRVAVSRDGQKAFVMTDKAQAAAFLEEWRTIPSEMILGTAGR